ncbi:glycosyltransferase family protein [Niveibacterium terrae]|uniref:glycosyltransferase family protein n=1 Tax=Niveibacterium terrae TaxID=3373598 RepID=UPI003A93E6CA
MKRKSAIAVFTEHYNATYFINFAAPLAHSPTQLLARSGDEIDAISRDALIDALELDTDGHEVRAAVLSRYLGPHAESILSFYRTQSIPVFFHLDDWLFGLPDDMEERYRVRYDARHTARLDEFLGRVDAILCSTPYLAGQMLSRSPQHTVRTLSGVCFQPQPGMSTAFKARACRIKRRLQHLNQVTIGYAGSSSHSRDMQLIEPALARLMAERENLHFHCFGLPAPEALRRRWANRVQTIGYTRDYPGYLQSLYELGWDIGLGPLIDDEFNRCKTATKLVEYASCAVPALCSDVEPYRRVFGQDSNSLVAPSDWYDALRLWLDRPALRRESLARARQRLRGRSPYAAAEELLTALSPVLPRESN